MQSRQNIQTPAAAHQHTRPARFNSCSCSNHQQGAIGFHGYISRAVRREVILMTGSQLRVHFPPLTWAGWRRRVRRVRRASRGRRSVSAGPGAPLSPPGPACQARCPPSPGTPAPGPGRRAPPGRSPTRSSSVPERRSGLKVKGQLISPAIIRKSGFKLHSDFVLYLDFCFGANNSK